MRLKNKVTAAEDKLKIATVTAGEAVQKVEKFQNEAIKATADAAVAAQSADAGSASINALCAKRLEEINTLNQENIEIRRSAEAIIKKASERNDDKKRT